MVIPDFEWYGITKFTSEEVSNTGADVGIVKLALMQALQKFRMDERINRVVVLLPGGMTSGAHQAPEHARGEAADISFRITQTPPITDVVNAAHQAGFRGIGVYHNGSAYSFHLDVGETYRSWSAFKRHGDTRWTYGPMFVDPAERATR
jgi:uncharacterized protein YcbK (DUF882 family)